MIILPLHRAKTIISLRIPKLNQMDKAKIDLFISANSEKFEPAALLAIRSKMEGLTDDQFVLLQSVSYQNPTTILLIAIFLGLDRIFLNDIALGILKVITCYGFMIWYLVDIFSATDRTKKYNYKKFNDTLLLM